MAGRSQSDTGHRYPRLPYLTIFVDLLWVCPRRLGVAAKIFVPTVSASAKIERIRRLGADLVVGGDRCADAASAAKSWAADSGALNVHPFDQRETLPGQGSVGLELAEQANDLDTVLVPVGGGGLIGGVSAYFAGTVRVIGVEPDGAPTLTYARAHGKPTDAPTGSIAADALAPRRVGDLVFPITQAHVSDVVLIDDDSIRRAQHALWEALRVIAEPAAAVGVAALLTGAYQPQPGERVAVIISGSNITPLTSTRRPPHHADRSGSWTAVGDGPAQARAAAAKAARAFSKHSWGGLTRPAPT